MLEESIARWAPTAASAPNVLALSATTAAITLTYCSLRIALLLSLAMQCMFRLKSDNAPTTPVWCQLLSLLAQMLLLPMANRRTHGRVATSGAPTDCQPRE